MGLPALLTTHTAALQTVLAGADLTPGPARPIFLLDCHVAGLPYHQAPQVLDRLRPDAPLRLTREPDNPHDELAIAVHWTADPAAPAKLGYVPRRHNPVLARLLDAGKELAARISAVQPHGTWMEVRMAIELVDW
jgi:hypothetical protein